MKTIFVAFLIYWLAFPVIAAPTLEEQFASEIGKLKEGSMKRVCADGSWPDEPHACLPKYPKEKECPRIVFRSLGEGKAALSWQAGKISDIARFEGLSLTKERGDKLDYDSGAVGYAFRPVAPDPMENCPANPYPFKIDPARKEVILGRDVVAKFDSFTLQTGKSRKAFVESASTQKEDGDRDVKNKVVKIIGDAVRGGGSAAGAFIGITFTPSRIGCQELGCPGAPPKP